MPRKNPWIPSWHYIEEKRKGNLKKLFVWAVCQSDTKNDLKTEMPEVDGFFGVWEMSRILEAAGTNWISTCLQTGCLLLLLTMLI